MIDAFDVASLEAFQIELLQVGFEPVDDEQRSWVGPIADTLRALTSAETMRIVFFDGWPFQHPRLFVDGIDEQHVTRGGDVCLWPPGAPINGWATAGEYLARIDEWATHAKTTFRPEDFALDAHLYFDRVRPGAIATVDLGSLRLSRANGGRGEISGSWEKNESVFAIKRGLRGAIEGRWYFVGSIAVPPRNLEAIRELLDTAQRANFDRRYKAVADGKARLFLIVWDRELGREALVLLASKHGSEIVAESIEAAPTDEHYLKLRGGPDVAALVSKGAVLFGAGAIGSNVALLVAQAGLGRLVAVDSDHLRPTNVVRHAADRFLIGLTKAQATKLLVNGSAPWTKVDPASSTWAPTKLREMIESADIVIEATGYATFTSLVSYLCAESGTPLVSAALYRGGAVGRVRRQAAETDVMIVERSEATGHPLIPNGDESVAYEPGCSAAVNNASPIAVAAVAATTAQVVVDTLTGRFTYPDEVIDVYTTLDAARFDTIGRLR